MIHFYTHQNMYLTKYKLLIFCRNVQKLCIRMYVMEGMAELQYWKWLDTTRWEQRGKRFLHMTHKKDVLENCSTFPFLKNDIDEGRGGCKFCWY